MLVAAVVVLKVELEVLLELVVVEQVEIIHLLVEQVQMHLVVVEVPADGMVLTNQVVKVVMV
jgi:hypothetical protein